MTERPFNEQLKAARRSLGITQTGAAAILGVSMQTISNWECARTKPTPMMRDHVLSKLKPRQQ